MRAVFLFFGRPLKGAKSCLTGIFLPSVWRTTTGWMTMPVYGCEKQIRRQKLDRVGRGSASERAGCLKRYQDELREDIIFYQYLQFEFFEQWKNVKNYAHEKGIQIVGDIPIYVAFDSADTWANPELFQFDENCEPVAVAGCLPMRFPPPDSCGAILCITGNITRRPVMPGGCSGWQPALNAMMWYVSIIFVDSMLIMRFPMGNPLRSTATEHGPGYDIFRSMKEIGRKRSYCRRSWLFNTICDRISEEIRLSRYENFAVCI